MNAPLTATDALRIDALPDPPMLALPWRDIYLDDTGLTTAARHAAVLALEALGLRAVTAWGGDAQPEQCLRVVRDCLAVLVPDGPDAGASASVRAAHACGLPVLPYGVDEQPDPPRLRGRGERSLERIRGDAEQHAPAATPYAFMAVRIHDDFALIRHAITCAVEAELGMPCVWFEDRRVVGTTAGVRERTAALIRGASFFVAELSYSASSPTFDSPNTAHEIGMALACGIPLVVCARAPRRNLYFLAGDLDTLFWRDEADLHRRLRTWLEPRRATLGRCVLADSTPRARLQAPAFAFDPALRYRGPPGLLQRTWARVADLSGRAPPVVR